MSRDLTLRLTALSCAHDLVRPVLGNPKKAAGDLFAVLLAPYVDKRPAGDRIRVTIPELLVGEASATTLALVVHELATNSIKYGALSTATGELDVSGTADDHEVLITWRERGGPAISATRGHSGFGSQLVINAVVGQLGGTIAFEWLSEGVVVVLRTSKARLGG